MGRFDIEERRDRSPWVLGMVVDPSERRRGVGRLLLAALCGWAKGSDWPGVWVATGGAAVTFYEACGWEVSERFERSPDQTTVVLQKRL